MKKTTANNQVEHLGSRSARYSLFPITFLATRSLHSTQLPSFRSTALTVFSSPSDGTMIRWLGVVVKGTASSILSSLAHVLRSCTCGNCIWGSTVKSSGVKDTLWYFYDVWVWMHMYIHIYVQTSSKALINYNQINHFPDGRSRNHHFHLIESAT